jgi:UDP-glucose 4-epimerase
MQPRQPRIPLAQSHTQLRGQPHQAKYAPTEASLAYLHPNYPSSKHGIKNFIFSSTAAVYGAPDHSNPIKEDDEKNPISPYGASKLAAEGEVNKFLAIPGNHGTSLRFFNVVAEETERRAGDPAFLCADVSLIKSAIGFGSNYSLEASAESLSHK